MRKPFLAVLIIAAAALAGQVTADELYKWVDDEGTTHYSAQPPVERDYEIISTRAGRLSSVPAQEAADTAAEGGDNADEPATVQPGRPDPAVLAAQCEQSRENLFWLEERTRVMMRDPETGEEHWLDDDERLAQIEETRQFISRNCD